MPLVITNPITREKMLAAQALWGLSDNEFGGAVLGREIEDPGKIIRSWKSGRNEPTATARQAFAYLEALVRIANNSPLDGEEIYALAHGALPACLK